MLEGVRGELQPRTFVGGGSSCVLRHQAVSVSGGRAPEPAVAALVNKCAVWWAIVGGWVSTLAVCEALSVCGWRWPPSSPRNAAIPAAAHFQAAAADPRPCPNADWTLAHSPTSRRRVTPRPWRP
jgi:hypothetical protein